MLDEEKALPLERDKLLAFAFGVVFVSVILGIAILNPQLSDFSYTVFRIVLALAAAGVGAVIPGFVAVRAGTWLRAGGAVALFVIVYFFAPVGATPGDGSTEPPPAHTGRPTADHWLKLVDQNSIGAAYQQMSLYFKSQYTESDVASLLGAERKALGVPINRSLQATSHYYNPPGSPKGYYVNFGYRTKFDKEKRNIYEAVQLTWEKKAWRVSGFYTYVKNDQGVMVSYDPADVPG